MDDAIRDTILKKRQKMKKEAPLLGIKISLKWAG
jgi:hypothetical protein